MRGWIPPGAKLSVVLRGDVIPMPINEEEALLFACQNIYFVLLLILEGNRSLLELSSCFSVGLSGREGEEVNEEE